MQRGMNKMKTDEYVEQKYKLKDVEYGNMLISIGKDFDSELSFGEIIDKNFSDLTDEQRAKIGAVLMHNTIQCSYKALKYSCEI
jgi:hypothetical protein